LSTFVPIASSAECVRLECRACGAHKKLTNEQFTALPARGAVAMCSVCGVPRDVEDRRFPRRLPSAPQYAVHPAVVAAATPEPVAAGSRV